ncbi:hypothetical protein MNAN1_001529 [Malassezia nana]|uniref:Uncharacterized protein n=1 Tax=Malassezia nana TaxID=180528 RepID=A0AAF0EKP5_9BASI|nr:hypothetical protein MNAN1_001529 [Malassezia nana]
MMVEQDDFSDLENFRVLPAEEMAPNPAKASTSLPSTDSSSTAKVQDNSVTQAGRSVWQWLSSFVKPAVTTATPETPNRDPTPGPVMNKKAI